MKLLNYRNPWFWLVLTLGNGLLCTLVNVVVYSIALELFKGVMTGDYEEALLASTSAPIQQPPALPEPPNAGTFAVLPKFSATASPLQPTPTAVSDYDAEAIYAIGPLNTWITAITANDYALAESVYRPGVEPERSETLRKQFDLTQAFLDQAVRELGAVQGVAALNSYRGESDDQRIGLGKTYFTDGSICFRMQMLKHDLRWYIADWEWITPAACKAEEARITP